MTKLKITVVKRFGPEDVFGTDHNIRQLSGELVQKCSHFNEGDEIIVDHIEKYPEGFCMWAWRDLYKDMSVLFFGGNFPRPEKGFAY
ncbi:MAG: TIGR04076 family protein, partial [Candidatus Thorarchaeota archaeon]